MEKLTVDDGVVLFGLRLDFNPVWVGLFLGKVGYVLIGKGEGSKGISRKESGMSEQVKCICGVEIEAVLPAPPLGKLFWQRVGTTEVCFNNHWHEPAAKPEQGAQPGVFTESPATEAQQETTLYGRNKDAWHSHVEDLFRIAIPGEDIPFAALYAWQIKPTEEDFAWAKSCIAAATDKEKVLNGAALIAAERQRQVSVEGWTPKHDDAHDKFEMTRAALAYAKYAERSGRYAGSRIEPMFVMNDWPGEWDSKWWKPSDDVLRNLVKAGALIAAEIDRLQRAASRLPVPAQTCEICNKPLDNGWEHGVKCGNQKACTYSEITYPIPAQPPLCMKRDPETNDACQLQSGHKERHNSQPTKASVVEKVETVGTYTTGPCEDHVERFVKRLLAVGLEIIPSSELAAIRAEVSRWKGLYEVAQAEIESLKEINHDWIKENGPGGWIDILRQSLQTARRDALEEAEALFDVKGTRVHPVEIRAAIRALQSELGLYKKTTEAAKGEHVK